jgi:hypothetical protein
MKNMRSISKILKSFSRAILKEVFRISEEGVELRRLRETFREIYRLFNLGLNNTIAGNEVNKITKRLSLLQDGNL